MYAKPCIRDKQEKSFTYSDCDFSMYAKQCIRDKQKEILCIK